MECVLLGKARGNLIQKLNADGGYEDCGYEIRVKESRTSGGKTSFNAAVRSVGCATASRRGAERGLVEAGWRDGG